MSIDSNQLRHISLRLGEQEARLRVGLYDALARAVDECPTNSVQRQVLDVGVGRGELLQRIQARGFAAHGIDLESGCVEIAGQFGDCRQGGIEDITRVFPDRDFDVIICSHVIEHLDNPHAALKMFAELDATSYVFAVPNPLRPVRMLRAIFYSRRADHQEHVYAWGHPEFASLLNRCGFTVDAWYTDRVTINPLRGRLGQTLTRLLGSFETRFLPYFFPLLSSSLIVRCHVSSKDCAR